MYIKALELNGFKSFASPTILHLDKEFTAIVGPNGSGKSNISEAIRWVFGEQSAKSLRGNKMEDIIFSGSKNRGPSPYAKVSLILDNQDHLLDFDQEEVVISRRYTRKGESTYEINGQATRLKDITSLLMDTGVGSDSFSVISQGSVEAILKQKPEERRSIIEEVAGVMKYKTRKHEAQNKLESSNRDLERLEDLLIEMEDRLLPLKEQKEQALRYKKDQKALEALEISFLVHELAKSKSLYQEAKQRKEEKDKERRKWINQRDKKKEKIEKLTDDQKALKQEIASLRLNREEKEEEYHDLQTTQLKKQEQQRYLLSQQKEKKKNLDTLVLSIQENLKNLQIKQEEENQRKKDGQAFQEALDHLKEDRQVFIQKIGPGFESLREAYLQLLQEENHAQNEVVSWKREVETSKYQKHQEEEKQNDIQNQKKRLKQKLEDLSLHDQNLKKQKERLDQKLLKNQKAFKENLQQRQALEASFQEKRAAYLDHQAKFEALKALEREGEGLYSGTKAILKLKEQLPGLRGALLDLIEVPKPYALAVETALGGSLQNLIVEDEQTAQQAIELLKRRRLGRATFLPIETVKGKELPLSIQEQLNHQEGYLGLMVDKVHFDEELRLMMNRLMGNILVSKDLSSARKIAKRLNYRYRIVTLEGESLQAGGALTGGKFRHENHLLVRKSEIKEHQSQMKVIGKEGKALQDQIQSLEKERMFLQDEEEQLRQSLRQQSAEYSQLQEKQNLWKNEEEKILKDQKVSEYNLELAENTLKEAKDKEKNAQLTYLHLKEKTEKVMKEMDEARKKENRYQKELEALKDKENELHLSLVLAKERQKETQKELNRLKDQKEALNQQKEGLQKELHELSQTIEKLKSTSFSETEALKKKEIETLKEAIDSKQKRMLEIEEYLIQQQKDQDKLQEVIEQAYLKQSEAEQLLAREEEKMDQSLSRLNEAYGLTYEMAQNKAEELNEESAKIQIRELKTRLASMGSVNLQAIEAYDQLKERFDFMTAQEKDVIEAKKKLLQTMEEMDQEVSKRFLKTYEQVSEAFSQVFPRIFGGGQAQLTLTKPNNPLETGIEIIAQAPGKKRQLLSLLSGGERALTVIALLFAILEVKAIPFSLLDEVEAALDDSNVERYGKYLEHFSSQTQFIVISHRKGTMEHANSLYGVTMQEPGISQVVNVSLKGGNYD